MFLFALEFYTKFEAWSVPPYIDTMGVRRDAMTRDELLALIDQAEREEWTELDLSNKGLTELPPEIGRFVGRGLAVLSLLFFNLIEVRTASPESECVNSFGTLKPIN